MDHHGDKIVQQITVIGRETLWHYYTSFMFADHMLQFKQTVALLLWNLMLEGDILHLIIRNQSTLYLN